MWKGSHTDLLSGKSMLHVIIMWKGSDTDLLSGKSMFIDMHDIDSPDKSAFCSTVYRHKYCGFTFFCGGLIFALFTVIKTPRI